MIGKFVSKCCDDNCVPFENPIPVTSLAQAYVPFQKSVDILSLERHLRKVLFFLVWQVFIIITRSGNMDRENLLKRLTMLDFMAVDMQLFLILTLTIQML